MVNVSNSNFILKKNISATDMTSYEKAICTTLHTEHFNLKFDNFTGMCSRKDAHITLFRYIHLTGCNFAQSFPIVS